MSDAPPRYDAEASNDATLTSQLGILQVQVADLQQQVTRLLETQRDQLIAQKLTGGPTPFNGKSCFPEWYWKMTGILEEIQSLDEKTKINYIVSRLTESAFTSVEEYLSPRLRPERPWRYRGVETADELMQLLKRKFSSWS